MIGLLNLPNGAWTVQHPRGPMWVLVRKGHIVRAELYDPVTNRIEVFPRDLSRQWAVNVRLAAGEIAEGVLLAG
jgi:hypothetical protein